MVRVMQPDSRNSAQKSNKIRPDNLLFKDMSGSACEGRGIIAWLILRLHTSYVGKVNPILVCVLYKIKSQSLKRKTDIKLQTDQWWSRWFPMVNIHAIDFFKKACCAFMTESHGFMRDIFAYWEVVNWKNAVRHFPNILTDFSSSLKKTKK